MLVVILSVCTAGAVRAEDVVPPVEAKGEAPLSADAQAAERFRRGMQLFDDGDFALALVELERAYELSPNYRALYNIGLVNIQLARYATAARTLRRYLEEGGEAVPAERRAEVGALLENLALRTATLTLVVRTAAAEVSLDGRKVEAGELAQPILVDAGEHRIEAAAEGFRARSYAVKVASQDRASVEIALEPLPLESPVLPRPEPAPEPQRRVFWPGVIGTAALAAGAVTSFAIMMRARSELSTLKSDPGSSAREREDLAQRVNVSAVSADALTGLSLIGGGVTLYLSLRKQPVESGPRVAVGARHVALSWRFP
jgi:hypothetical protein